MIKTSLLIDYEKVAINKKYKNYKVKQKDEEADEEIKNAVYILKYVFNNILEWSPTMVRDYFTPDIAEWLNLTNCTSKIPFPSELDKNKDFFYIASYIYPKEVPYKKKNIVLDMYEQERYKERPKFNKDFFNLANGKENYDICLRYILAERFINSEKEEIYAYFANNKQGRQFLRENNLLKPLSQHYDCVLEAVHNALNEADKDETLYYYYYLMSELKRKKIRCAVRSIK